MSEAGFIISARTIEANMKRMLLQEYTVELFRPVLFSKEKFDIPSFQMDL